MSNSYDRFDDDRGGGSFVIGLLTGTVLGAGLGMLFAPKSGSELRQQISGQATEGYRRASETAQEWAEKGREKGREAYEKGREAYEKGREVYDKTRDTVTRAATETERFARDVASSTQTPSSSGTSQFRS
jgi:gas vesicle protein